MTFMDIDYRVVLVVIGTILCLQNYGRYIFDTINKRFKPHMFSWGIWSLLSGIAFAAQLSEDAGPGMWQTGIMTVGTAIITAMAYVYGDRNYTKSDWAALFFALSAIPLWLATNNPLWSVILITLIDVVAFWPTVRKAWARPHEESARMFYYSGLICALGFFGLSVLNLTTGLYQGAIALLNICMATMIIFRRRAIPAAVTP